METFVCLFGMNFLTLIFHSVTQPVGVRLLQVGVLLILLVFRTLFDYDPTCDAGLPGRGLDFRFGHILNVVGDDDADWWHAVRVVPDDGGSGVVPSKRRLLLDDCFCIFSLLNA